ncbi:MAG: hypothetical protein FRX49_00242 [Trebouxia sp. A1-2]|nr:MAG: hypothetical protein FRX49_00242 [Trebouxia sp. A1-2]
MGSNTLSKMRVQKGRVKAEPWNLRVSNSTSRALYRMSGRGSNVSSDRPASRGNQKYICQLLSTQTVQQLDGAMAGSAIQGAFWHSRQAPLYCGAPAVGDPGVLIRLASRWPDAIHVRVEVRLQSQTHTAKLTDGSFCQLHGTEAQEGDSIEGDVYAVGVVGERDEAVDTVCEDMMQDLHDKYSSLCGPVCSWACGEVNVHMGVRDG